MASKFFTTLLQRQIDTFLATFQEDAASLFRDAHNTLIHPGEYGMYREQCFCALLRSVLPRDCTVSDGFVFSSRDDSITTQCDILVKNANAMPLIDSGIAKFHPVEDIYAVVEMKSNLTKDELREALQKLARVKMKGDDRKTRRDCRDYQKKDGPVFDPIPTFLVCNKLMFSGIDTLDFRAIYTDIDPKYWHNGILSVEDGLLQYKYKPADLPDLPDLLQNAYQRIASHDANAVIQTQYPQLVFQFQDKTVVHDCMPDFIPAQPARKYDHIMDFLSQITQAVSVSEKYQFDAVQYINRDCADYLSR